MSSETAYAPMGARARRYERRKHSSGPGRTRSIACQDSTVRGHLQPIGTGPARDLCRSPADTRLGRLPNRINGPRARGKSESWCHARRRTDRQAHACRGIPLPPGLSTCGSLTSHERRHPGFVRRSTLRVESSLTAVSRVSLTLLANPVQ